MWTATITNVIADEVSGIAKVTFEYTDGVRTETITERISEPDSYKKIAQDKVRELNRRDAIAEFIANPPLGEIELVRVPTAEELKAQADAALKYELTQAKANLDLKLITQAEYDALVATYKTETTKTK